MKTNLNVNYKNAQMLIFGLETDLSLTPEQKEKVEKVRNILSKLRFPSKKQIKILAATLNKINNF